MLLFNLRRAYLTILNIKYIYKKKMKRSLQTRTTTFHSTPIVQGFLNQKYPEIVKQKEEFKSIEPGKIKMYVC